MKCAIKFTILLGVLTGMPSFLLAKDRTDSLLIDRIFQYQKTVPDSFNGMERNVYMKYQYDIKRRNAVMWLIPTMYPLAKGDRRFLMESYSRVTFNDVDDYNTRQQIVWGTVPRYRKAMSPVLEFLKPNLYAETLYPDHTLSPFNRYNRQYYRYTTEPFGEKRSKVAFRPRYNNNTQLVRGFAYADNETGRITKVVFEGDFDGISFHTEAAMGDEGVSSLLPKMCYSEARFHFAGNRVSATFEASYNQPVTLSDTLINNHSRELIDSLRPYPLTDHERSIYAEYDSLHPKRQVTVDTVSQQKKGNTIVNVFDVIGENLVTSIRARNEKGSLRIYPLLSPQYLSYSSRYGIAYKIRMKSDYHFNAHRYFDFNPQLGYNFKFKKFYYTLPLRFTYNPKRDGFIELVYGNGNRTRHSSVVNEIEREHNDTLDTSGLDLDMFDDSHLRLTNNIMAFDWIDIETGFAFHRRKAYYPERMRQFGKPTEYRSFAPVLSLKLRPWTLGPVFTIDYERGITGVNKSNIDYERWEFDTSIKRELQSMRKINVRVGGGFYSRKRGNYFVDYDNFRDNNLPEGWDDDWTGNFQLLNSRWYNESQYYVRTNLSYDSPLLLLSWVPVLGHFMERERIYLSALSIEHTRPYFELGYGFTTRFVSIGMFANFLNAEPNSFECKFTFELFRRW